MVDRNIKICLTSDVKTGRSVSSAPSCGKLYYPHQILMEQVK